MTSNKVKVVAFDADDTLWDSESFFAVTEERFNALVAPWCASAEDAANRLLATERANLTHFGYGIKGFVISMIETAIQLSDGTIPVGAIEQIIEWGKEMLSHPVTLLPDVVECLDWVGERYRVILVTKGDLFHQESKIAESGLADRFESIHIVTEKDPSTYARIIAQCGIEPAQFLMVGNSVPSDVTPVRAAGGQAVHVPHFYTWAHERPNGAETQDFPVLERLSGLISVLS